MRFVVGAFSTQRQDFPLGRLRPRGGEEVPFDTAPVWAVGYGPLSVRSAPAEGGGAELVAFGECLATFAERREARDSAERGAWAHAARLPGSYLALVRVGDTVRVIGDRAGVHVVYWLHDGDVVVWSTSALVLAAYAGSRPSLPRLLASMSVYGVDHLGEHSLFDGVHRVPPGEALVLAPGRSPRAEPVGRPRAAVGLAEGARNVAEHLTTAVERRATLDCDFSCDLSGGVDSSTVTALAAARAPLLAVTYTDRDLAGQDDLRYARRIAAEHRWLRHAVVDGTQQRVQHFDLLHDAAALPVTESPSLSVGLLGIKQAQLAPAVAYGSRLHLTGRGGDNVLDSAPICLVDLARAGRRREAAARAAAFARARRVPLYSVLGQIARTIRTPLPGALDDLAAALADKTPPASGAHLRPAELLAACGPLPAAGWLSPAGRAAVAELVAERAQAVPVDALPGAWHERIALERMGEEHATFDQISRQMWGLPIHAPYLDGLAVDACLAVPGWQRWMPGDFKPLARAAFTGTVPGFLLQRRTKTPMTTSLHRGLRANAGTLRAIITRSRLADADLLDTAPALAALDAAARGELAPLASVHQLIAIELWLATIPTSRDHWWSTAPTLREAA